MFLIRIPRPGQDVKRPKKRGILIMNKYKLEAVVDGEYIQFHQLFNTRDEAIDYIFRYYDDHLLVNLEVNEEYYVDGNKHDVAYVYDYYNRFRIARA